MIFKTLTILGMFAIAATILVVNQTSVKANEEQLSDPDNLITALSALHPGPWFGFQDGIQDYEHLEIYDSKYSVPTKSELTAVLNEVIKERNTRAINEMVLAGERQAIESRLKDGTYTDADIVRYLRILGDF